MLQTVAKRSGLVGCLTPGKTWMLYTLIFSERIISQLKPPLRIRASATASHLVGLDRVWTGYTSAFSTVVTAYTRMYCPTFSHRVHPRSHAEPCMMLVGSTSAG